MGRTARIKSGSGYYHVIARGIGRQLLFEDAEDHQVYKRLLRKYRDESSIIICAYCLMDNHVHLLLREAGGGLASFMHRTGSAYAKYFNDKYERVGHLFQDRYKSEAIDTERYLARVFVYILRNPETAGICRACDYEWSSYREYGVPGSLSDSSSLQPLLGDPGSLDKLLAEPDAAGDEGPIEFFSDRSDERALERFRLLTGLESGSELQKLSRAERDAILRMLRQKGFPVRQIERLTGIGRGIIQRK